MKTLILIRHAKSSWDVPISDKDRELITAGIETIIKMAHITKSFLPEILTIWSSTAKRAIQTAQLYCENAALAKENIIYQGNLYTFNANDLLQIISECDNKIDYLMIFGHNSAITDFVNHFGDKYINNVPTAGIVFIKFDQDNWQNIKKGKVINTFFPKEKN